jgi:hypothetical protein
MIETDGSIVIFSNPPNADSQALQGIITFTREYLVIVSPNSDLSFI